LLGSSFASNTWHVSLMYVCGVSRLFSSEVVNPGGSCGGVGVIVAVGVSVGGGVKVVVAVGGKGVNVVVGKASAARLEQPARKSRITKDAKMAFRVRNCFSKFILFWNHP
jgi:hypothetical protein